MRRHLLALPLLLPSPALAEWVEAHGSYLFPPSMAETEACSYAEDRARAEAVRQVTGETVAAEDVQRCTEQGDETQCARNSALWSSMQGYIRRTGDKAVRDRAAPRPPPRRRRSRPRIRGVRRRRARGGPIPPSMWGCR